MARWGATGFITIALAAGSLASAAAPPPSWQQGRAGGILGTSSQVEVDRKAAEIFASKPVQDAIAELTAVYLADDQAKLPGARGTARRAAEANAMSQSIAAVAKDTGRPSAHWATTSPHSWGDVRVPLSGTMIDNPDNIYRSIPIDGAASYVIKGRIVFPAPAQQTFTLYNQTAGTQKNEKVRSNLAENGSLSLQSLAVERDGSFTITVDASPANGRPNHLQTDPEARNASILVRDTLVDWGRENPVQLSVTRTAGPPIAPVPSHAELTHMAASLTGSTAAYYLSWVKNGTYSGPPNGFTHNFNRVSGWGGIKQGHYRLERGEALIVTVDRRDAAYLGFQLADTWGQGQASEFIARTGSLNASQARANRDGSYTFVIAPDDPGVHNWLDTAGLHAGIYGVRWQQMPLGVNLDDAVRDMRVVKATTLKDVLPPETVWVTPEERKAQLAKRMADYARRLQF